ncbi:MAG TPA: hypothetical protein VK591_18770, partial [Xanthobacteraceae bacterium]|nr:hypothetical protein [Xanthobacteraceae bacterium]
MANYPKKLMDPTEAALSAIQEALNVRDDEERQAAPPDDSELPLAHSADAMPQTEPARPAFDESIDLDDIDTRGPRIAEPLPFHAANDDQQSIGRILRALQDRPARTSYLVAAMFSAAWVVGCLALSWAYLADFNAALGPGHSPAAAMIGLGAAALLPIIFFFGIAHMAWRSQELRLITQSMAQVAMRLAEPESVARDSIVTVGQAIRREVAAMGDGVERALARAGELETLVQNEVAALERTYSDNEVRIRGLLQELTNQRDTLVGQAEQVRSAINNVHIDLTQDLSTITDLVGQQVNEAAQRITHSLAERGEHITLALGQVGDSMIEQLGVRGNDLLVRLENASEESSRAITTASEETSRAISIASDQLTSNLNFKTDHVGEDFAEIVSGLEDMMTARLDRVTEGFSEKSLAIVDLMIGRSQEVADLVSGRAQELSDAIIDTSSQLAETIAMRADEVNATLKASGESLILDLSLRGGDVAKKLEETGERITETLTSRSATVTDTLRDSVEQFVDTVATRGDAMKDMLSTRLAAFEEVFSHSGAELGEKISRDSATLGNLIT